MVVVLSLGFFLGIRQYEYKEKSKPLIGSYSLGEGNSFYPSDSTCLMQRKIMSLGDTFSYYCYISEDDFQQFDGLFYSFYMANKYEYPEACEKIFEKLRFYIDQSKFIFFSRWDDKYLTKKEWTYLLIKAMKQGVTLGSKNCKRILDDISNNNHYVRRDSIPLY